MKRFSSLPLALLALAAISGPALAQAPGAPGVCVLDRDAMFSQSLAGKSVGEQLRKLISDADTALKAERATIEKDTAGFRSLQATLPAEQRTSRASELQKRIDALNVKAETNRREIEGAERAALQRILTDAMPVIQQVSVQQKCGIVFDVNAVLAFTNPAGMDLTKATIEGLNAKLKTVPVTRTSASAGAAKPNN